MPSIADRIDARRRPVLEASLAKAGIKAKIDEFFRLTAELGAGNDEFAALQEFSKFVKKRKELKAFLAQPAPHVPTWNELHQKLGSGGSEDRPRGGRGVPS